MSRDVYVRTNGGIDVVYKDNLISSLPKPRHKRQNEKCTEYSNIIHKTIDGEASKYSEHHDD